jgi:hypothetical protein
MSGKVKWSNFHITVNYNIDGEEHIEAMRRAVEAMPEHPYLWQWLKQYDGSSQIDFAGASKLEVDSVRLRAAFEHGGKQNHGLHVHIVVEIGHTTMVQISKHGVIDVFRAFLDENCNVHCRFIKGSGEDKDFILRYITKEVPRYHPRDQNNSRLRSAFLRGEVIADAENNTPS